MADGTADAPIVMTSDAAIGVTRTRTMGRSDYQRLEAPSNQGITFGEGDTGGFRWKRP